MVALGASGGKDSTVLAHMMKTLNERHKCASSCGRVLGRNCFDHATVSLESSDAQCDVPYALVDRALATTRCLHMVMRRSQNGSLYSYGLTLWLLSVDEGIAGYRDDSLETVKRNEQQYGMPLKIVSYKDLYGWTMDEIVKQIGKRGNCTFCGVFRRQALDRGAHMLQADKVATGHNADDIAETVILNIMRGDLARCAHGGRTPCQSVRLECHTSFPSALCVCTQQASGR